MGFKEDRLRIRAYVSNIKINTPCQDCCQYFPEEAVDFDHVHGFKIDSISNMVNYSDLETIKKEIEKCDIRCANCHRIKTARDFGYFKLLGMHR